VGAVLAKSENSSAAFRYRSALFKSCISATPNTHKQMKEEMDLECGDAGANQNIVLQVRRRSVGSLA
jgi:hypothetical protein